jgi:hypothetical protein
MRANARLAINFAICGNHGKREAHRYRCAQWLLTRRNPFSAKGLVRSPLDGSM